MKIEYLFVTSIELIFRIFLFFLDYILIAQNIQKFEKYIIAETI